MKLEKQGKQALLIIVFNILFSLTSLANDNVVTLNNTINRKLSLPECISVAINNSPELMSSKEEIEVSRARLAEARSGYFPRLKQTSSYTYFNSSISFKFKYPESFVNTMAEASVNNALKQQALAAGINPLTGNQITDYNILQQAAAAQGTTPAALYQGMVNTAATTAINSGSDVLQVPILGNNLFKLELSMQQPLFLWGKVYYSNKQAKAGIEVSKSQLIETRNNIVYDVIERYNQVLLAKDVYKLADETEINFETLRDMVKAAFNGKVENVSKLDYLQVEGTLGLIRSKKFEAEKGLSLAKTALRYAMGLDDYRISIDATEESQSYEIKPVNLDKSVALAIANRPEFFKLKNGIKAKEYEIKTVNADNRPKVVMDTAFGAVLDELNQIYPNPLNFRLTLGAEVPIFDGLRTRAKANQVRHEIAKLHQDNRKLTNGVVLQVNEAYLNLEEAQKKLVSIEEAVCAATENRILSRNAFELDIVETKKVIDAQILEAMVKLERIQSIYNYNISQAKLKKVISDIDSLIPNPILPVSF